MAENNSNIKKNWFEQTEYIIFSNELTAIKHNNEEILEECRTNKRLLDLKFRSVSSIINNIQTSVIFLSTISGFLHATKSQFGIDTDIITVTSIGISTYISLLLSIAKYYKYDEQKEQLQSLRDKYSVLHNTIEHRIDLLEPWYEKNLWIHQDASEKKTEWDELCKNISLEYSSILDTKQQLVTEFEMIMDTMSRNEYTIKNKKLVYENKKQLNLLRIKEKELDLEMEQP